MVNEQIKRDALELKETLGITTHFGRMDGSVAIGLDTWHVFIFDKVKRPPLIKWKGWPIVYHIGHGRAIAN